MINKIIYRYILKKVFLCTFYSLLVLLLLNFIIKFTEQIGLISSTYNVYKVIFYCLTTTLFDIYLFLPISFLLGTVIGLGIFYANKELIVLFSVGIKRRKIFLLIFFYLLIPFSIFNLIATSYIYPKLQNIAINVRYSNNFASYGIWEKDQNQFIYIRQITPLYELEDIKINTFNHGILSQIIQAKKSIWDENNKVWVLQNVYIKDITDDQIIVRNVDKYIWHSSITSKRLKFNKTPANNLSIVELYNYIKNKKSDLLTIKNFELAFWNKVLYPINLFVMFFIGISLVLSSFSRNSSVILKTLYGIILGLCYYILSTTLSPILFLYGLNMVISVLIPSFIFFVLGMFLLRKL